MTITTAIVAAGVMIALAISFNCSPTVRDYGDSLINLEYQLSRIADALDEMGKDISEHDRNLQRRE